MICQFFWIGVGVVGFSTRGSVSEVTVLQLERAVDWKDSLVPGEGKELQVPAEAQDKLRELFKMYSKDGFLSRKELTSLLQKLHPKWASGGQGQLDE